MTLNPNRFQSRRQKLEEEILRSHRKRMKVEMLVAQKSGCSRRRRYQTRKQVLLRRGSEKRDFEEDDEDNIIINKRGNSKRRRRNSNQNRKHKKRRPGLGLSVRRSSESAGREVDDESSQSEGKRTILSWLVDCGTISLNGVLWYMDWTRRHPLLKGNITKDGILCSCCKRIVTVSEFEVHAGSNRGLAYQNIVVVEKGVSLMQCQLDTWNQQEESARRESLKVNSSGKVNADPTDDVCGVCGDGGDLICCDGCPSTFHHTCLGIQMVPQGEWHCPHCLCKFCGLVGGNTDQLLTCSQCEEKYHRGCIRGTEAVLFGFNTRCPSFCEQSCKKLFEKLQNLIGAKNELVEGFSWTLVRRLDEESNTLFYPLPKRAEFNSKIAIALKVMEECFMPIIDRRSGINMIQNVVYNRGSNYNRLNYSGFYTAVLERGDEILCVASIRIHGTKLAEIPFIGTRRIYRCQGMCRRLLNAIESALCFLNVEKLMIPSIMERVEKWTNGFGFEPIDDSLKQEMRSMNLLMFPDTVALQKVPFKHNPTIEKETAGTSDVNTNGLQRNNYQIALDTLHRSLKEAPVGMNRQHPNEGSVNDPSTMCRKKPCSGVFLTIDSEGRLKITRWPA